jgi:hypothetical protein
MLFRSWLRSLESVSRHTPNRGKRLRVVEGLEDRALPSTVTWTNSAGGDWDTPSNWDANRVPIATDDAVINFANITVTHSSSAADSANSLTSQAAIALSAGSLSLTNASLVNNALNISGGTLTNSGNTIVNGSLTWGNGTLSGSGSLTANGGMTITGGDTLDGLASLTLPPPIGRAMTTMKLELLSSTGRFLPTRQAPPSTPASIKMRMHSLATAMSGPTQPLTRPAP